MNCFLFLVCLMFLIFVFQKFSNKSITAFRRVTYSANAPFFSKLTNSAYSLILARIVSSMTDEAAMVFSIPLNVRCRLNRWRDSSTKISSFL